MHHNVTVFDIMIASPGDVEKERNEIVEAIRNWNANNLDANNVMLRPLTWEVDVPRGSAVDTQSLIDETIIKKSDMLIALFWKTLGRNDPSANNITYTIGEIKKHIDAGKPVIIFFKKPDGVGKNGEETDRIARVQKFKENLKNFLGKDCLYYDFSGDSDFNIYSRLDNDINFHLLKNSSLSTNNIQVDMGEPFTVIKQHHVIKYIDATTYHFEKEVTVRANFTGIRHYDDAFKWNAEGNLEFHAYKGNGQECTVTEDYRNSDGWRHIEFTCCDKGTVKNKVYTYKIIREFTNCKRIENQFLAVVSSCNGLELSLELIVPNSMFVKEIKQNRYHFAEESTPYDSADLQMDESCHIIYTPSNVKAHEKYLLEWSINDSI